MTTPGKPDVATIPQRFARRFEAPTKLVGSAGCSGIPPIGSTVGASRLGPDDVGTFFRTATDRRIETVNRRAEIAVRPSIVSLTSPRGFDSLVLHTGRGMSTLNYSKNRLRGAA